MNTSNIFAKLKNKYYSESVRKVLIKTSLFPVVKIVYNKLHKMSLDEIRTEKVLGHQLQFHQDSIVEQRQINTSVNEAKVIKRITERSNPGSTVFDIGGNIGVHACLVRKSMGKSNNNEVISFEPHPNNAQRLRQNAKLNEVDVHVEQVALFDREGTMTLHSVSENPGEGKHALKTKAEKNNLEKIEVETIPGDLYIEKKALSYPNVIKIDVEGAEYQVLSGLSDTLEKDACRSVFVEVHNSKLPVFDSNEKKIKQILRNSGFELRQIRHRESEYFIEATKSTSNGE